MPDTLEIASGPFTARFAPAMGGRMTELYHQEFGHILVPITSSQFDPLNWPRAGAYPLFPFHNRLVGASFQQSGTLYKIAAHPSLAGDAIHGPSHRRPWQVVAHAPAQFTMQLDYEADEDWPFSFRAQQSFSLSPEGLIVSLSLANTDAAPMPSGIGWHPYLSASLDRTARTDARLAFALNTSDLPTGEPAKRRTDKLLPQRSGYTIHLSEWSSAEVILDCNLVLTLSAEPPLSHVAVHRMPGYICIEPVSHAANALSLEEDARCAAGVAVQKPGEVLTGKICVMFKT